jgi:hypothetical protein
MQCFNCGFHNMPGSRGCARCGADFALATAAIDVQPPRASGSGRRMAGARAAIQRLAGRRPWGEFGDRTGHHDQTGDAPVYRAFDLPAAVIAAFLAIASPPALVPGLPHMLAGRGLLGGAICLAWILLMVAGISSVATVRGGLLLALAVTLHAASAALTTRVLVHSFRLRFARNAGFGLAVLTICYLPVAWLVSRAVFPLGVYVDRPPLAAGDVVWVRRGESPRPGEIWYAAGLRALVRVRAVAGQQVTWQKGLLLVDGEASPWQPADWAFADGTTATVGPGEALVFDVPFVPPDVPAPGRRMQYPDAQLRQSGAVTTLAAPGSGRIVFRSYPWSRLGRLQ